MFIPRSDAKFHGVSTSQLVLKEMLLSAMSDVLTVFLGRNIVKKNRLKNSKHCMYMMMQRLKDSHFPRLIPLLLFLKTPEKSLKIGNYIPW